MPYMLHLHHSPHQTSSVRRIDRRAAIAWDALRVLALFVAPVGLATFEAVAILAQAGYLVAAWLTIALVFLLGVAVARTAGRPVPSSPTVRRINRRAAIVLPAAAVLLAGLLELVATHGLVPLVALAYVATYAGVMMFAGWASWHLAPACGRLVAAMRDRHPQTRAADRA